ncbi:MAG: hypothetical protein ACM3MG_12250 [Bacillota bacterium]
MKQVFFIGAVLLMTLTSQASTKVSFSQEGTFIVHHNGGPVVTKQGYTIQSISGRIYSETSSNNKAFGQWKNCYENKREEVEFPIPWKQTMYDPFVDWFDVNLSVAIDQNEKSITLDEGQIADLIAQSVSTLNQKTSGKCDVKSMLLVRVNILGADGSADSFLLTFALKNGTLLVRYDDTKIIDAYNVDSRNQITIPVPNDSNPIPVFGNKL